MHGGSIMMKENIYFYVGPTFGCFCSIMELHGSIGSLALQFNVLTILKMRMQGKISSTPA